MAGGSDYTGKPRPVVIIQADAFDATESIAVCGITTTDVDAPHFRVDIEPSSLNGLAIRSFVMVDKINAVRRIKLGRKIGALARQDFDRIDRSIALFLGLTRDTSA